MTIRGALIFTRCFQKVSFQVAFVTTTEDVDGNGIPDLYAIMNYGPLEQTFKGELTIDDWDDDEDYSWVRFILPCTIISSAGYSMVYL